MKYHTYLVSILATETYPYSFNIFKRQIIGFMLIEATTTEDCINRVGESASAQYNLNRFYLNPILVPVEKLTEKIQYGLSKLPFSVILQPEDFIKYGIYPKDLLV